MYGIIRVFFLFSTVYNMFASADVQSLHAGIANREHKNEFLSFAECVTFRIKSEWEINPYQNQQLENINKLVSIKNSCICVSTDKNICICKINNNLQNYNCNVVMF